eukprot:ANDGO_07828.mRNA.1 Uncharacterized protein C1494.07
MSANPDISIFCGNFSVLAAAVEGISIQSEISRLSSVFLSEKDQLATSRRIRSVTASSHLLRGETLELAVTSFLAPCLSNQWSYLVGVFSEILEDLLRSAEPHTLAAFVEKVHSWTADVALSCSLLIDEPSKSVMIPECSETCATFLYRVSLLFSQRLFCKVFSDCGGYRALSLVLQVCSRILSGFIVLFEGKNAKVVDNFSRLLHLVFRNIHIIVTKVSPDIFEDHVGLHPLKSLLSSVVETLLFSDAVAVDFSVFSSAASVCLTTSPSLFNCLLTSKLNCAPKLSRNALISVWIGSVRECETLESQQLSVLTFCILPALLEEALRVDSLAVLERCQLFSYLSDCMKWFSEFSKKDASICLQLPGIAWNAWNDIVLRAHLLGKNILRTVLQNPVQCGIHREAWIKDQVLSLDWSQRRKYDALELLVELFGSLFVWRQCPAVFSESLLAVTSNLIAKSVITFVCKFMLSLERGTDTYLQFVSDLAHALCGVQSAEVNRGKDDALVRRYILPPLVKEGGLYLLDDVLHVVLHATDLALDVRLRLSISIWSCISSTQPRTGTVVYHFKNLPNRDWLLLGLQHASPVIRTDSFDLVFIHSLKDAFAWPSEECIGLYTEFLRNNCKTTDASFRWGIMDSVARFLDFLRSVVYQVFEKGLTRTKVGKRVKMIPLAMTDDERQSGIQSFKSFFRWNLDFISTCFSPSAAYDRRAFGVDLLSIFLQLFSEATSLEVFSRYRSEHFSLSFLDCRSFGGELYREDICDRLFYWCMFEPFDRTRQVMMDVLQQFPDFGPPSKFTEFSDSLWMGLFSVRSGKSEGSARALSVLAGKYPSVVEATVRRFSCSSNTVPADCHSSMDTIIFLVADFLAQQVADIRDDPSKARMKNFNGIINLFKFLVARKAQIPPSVMNRFVYDIFGVSLSLCYGMLGWKGDATDCRGVPLPVSSEEECPEFANEDEVQQDDDFEDFDESTDTSRSFTVNLWKLTRGVAHCMSIFIEQFGRALPFADFSFIGNTFLQMLLNTKHIGAVDKTQNAFFVTCRFLLDPENCRCFSFDSVMLVSSWADNVLNRINDPDTSILRRSSGLPFALSTILRAEPAFRCVSTSSFLRRVTFYLVKLCDSASSSLEVRVHSLNILRQLLMDTILGSRLDFAASQLFALVLKLYSSDSWTIRNSATLCFSSLLSRFLGQKTDSDDLAPENRMTVVEFGSRFANVLPMFLESIQGAHGRLYMSPLLMLLSRLSPYDDDTCVESGECDEAQDFHAGHERIMGQLKMFAPYIDNWARLPSALIRRRAAAALFPLFPLSEVAVQTCQRLMFIAKNSLHMDQNSLHGAILQVHYLFSNSFLHMPRHRSLQLAVESFTSLLAVFRSSKTMFTVWSPCCLHAFLDMVQTIVVAVQKLDHAMSQRMCCSLSLIFADLPYPDFWRIHGGFSGLMRTFVELATTCFSSVNGSISLSFCFLLSQITLSELEILEPVTQAFKMLLLTNSDSCDDVLQFAVNCLCPIIEAESHPAVVENVVECLVTCLDHISLSWTSRDVEKNLPNTLLSSISNLSVEYRVQVLAYFPSCAAQLVELCQGCSDPDQTEKVRWFAARAVSKLLKSADSSSEISVDPTLHGVATRLLQDESDDVRQYLCSRIGSRKEIHWMVALYSFLDQMPITSKIALLQSFATVSNENLDKQSANVKKLFQRERPNEFSEDVLVCGILGYALTREADNIVDVSFADQAAKNIARLEQFIRENIDEEPWIAQRVDVYTALVSNMMLLRISGRPCNCDDFFQEIRHRLPVEVIKLLQGHLDADSHSFLI